jgi:glucose-6-phosphate isomerase
VNFMLGRHGETVERRIQQLVSEGAAARIWRRDATFWRGDSADAAASEREKSVSNRLGWLDVARTMRERAADIESFANEVRAAGFTAAVLLGMGGSSLAPEVFRRSIARDEEYPPLFVLDTTDPATIIDVESRIDLEHTLFFVSSKSGGTLEPNVLFAYFFEQVRAARIDGAAGGNFVAITDEGTSLQALAREHGFRRVFTNPGDIGGRYSALSYFGLVPAAVTGVDVRRLLDGALAAMDAAQAADSDALRLGAALGEFARNGRDKLTFLLPREIESLGLWLEQLIAESTGKEGTGIVPVADELPGSPAKYGDDRLFAQMRLEDGYDAGNDSVTGALTAEGCSAIVIDLEDPYDLGAEMFRWEFAVAVAGQVLGINPFDEPNVQESKDNTNRVLAEFEGRGALDVSGIDAGGAMAIVPRANGPDRDLLHPVQSLLAQLHEGDYFAITAYVRQSEHSDEVFRDIRALVRDTLGCATTLGYGPRFLHSTGQLHKGGPPRGVFLQVTATDEPDVAIPGKPYSFGQLKRAQAIGDFESLIAHGRPVVRVHLGTDIEAGLDALLNALRMALTAPASGRR